MTTITHEGLTQSELTREYSQSLDALIDALMNSTIGLGKEHIMASYTSYSSPNTEKLEIKKERKIPFSNGFEIDFKLSRNYDSHHGNEVNNYVRIDLNKGNEQIMGFTLRTGGMESLGFGKPVLVVDGDEVGLGDFGISHPYPGGLMALHFDKEQRDKFGFLGTKLAKWITNALETGELGRTPLVEMKLPDLIEINRGFQERADAAKSLEV